MKILELMNYNYHAGSSRLVDLCAARQGIKYQRPIMNYKLLDMLLRVKLFTFIREIQQNFIEIKGSHNSKHRVRTKRCNGANKNYFKTARQSPTYRTMGIIE